MSSAGATPARAGVQRVVVVGHGMVGHRFVEALRARGLACVGLVIGAWPADPDQMSMPRVVLEAVLYTDVGPVRLLSTHLEYYSAPQRMAQAEALRTIHAEACDHAVRLSLHGKVNGPFAPTERPAAAIICGDFNDVPNSYTYFGALTSRSLPVPLTNLVAGQYLAVTVTLSFS